MRCWPRRCCMTSDSSAPMTGIASETSGTLTSLSSPHRPTLMTWLTSRSVCVYVCVCECRRTRQGGRYIVPKTHDYFNFYVLFLIFIHILACMLISIVEYRCDIPGIYWTLWTSREVRKDTILPCVCLRAFCSFFIYSCVLILAPKAKLTSSNSGSCVLKPRYKSLWGCTDKLT